MAHPRALSVFTLMTALFLLLALAAPTPASAARAAPFCTGYDACNAAGMPHRGYKENAGNRYWGMFPGHNCTNYVAYRMIRNGMSTVKPWPTTGYAYNWGIANAALTDGNPRVGSVAWWNSSAGLGTSGHVAYVESVISPTEIVVSEDAYGGDFTWRRITTSTNWPSGFIHFTGRREPSPVSERGTPSGTPTAARSSMPAGPGPPTARWCSSTRGTARTPNSSGPARG